MFKKKFIIFFFSAILAICNISCQHRKIAYRFPQHKSVNIALVVSGPINDSSWNAAAYSGLKRFQNDYGGKISVIEKVSLNEAKDVFSELGRRKFDFVIGQGYEYGFIVEKIARKYPETFFSIIGGEVNKDPNLCSFKFKDEQFGYLIGIVAGLNTATNKVGIVVGKNLPSVERTILGLRKGLKFVNPKADLVVSYINSWNDINKGKEAGGDQINTGVDVLTHLADLSGIGVIKAAEEADVSVIGTISDQHDIAPSTVITSALEDASQLTYLACEHYFVKVLRPEIYSFGLRHQIIDLTPSYGNIDPTNETKINRIKEKLTEQEIAEEQFLEDLKEQKKSF